MKIMSIALTILAASLFFGCNPDMEEPLSRPPAANPGENPDNGGGTDPEDPENPPQTTHKMRITIGSATFSATLAENATADAFRRMLPMTLGMSELNGNEKYYNLPGNFPTNASNPGTIRNGDLMLYGSNTLVLFYKTFSSSYSYTSIGRIDNPPGLETVLGQSSVTIKFEASDE